MKRINFYLPEQTIGKLQKLSQYSGLTVSELIRRGIDDFILAQDSAKKVMAKFAFSDNNLVRPIHKKVKK